MNLKTYKILSNVGVGNIYLASKEVTKKLCDILNNAVKGTDIVFSIIEETPYRLIVPLNIAMELHAFPFEAVITDNKTYAAYYLTEREFREQSEDETGLWHINCGNKVLTATFDDAWFDAYNYKNYLISFDTPQDFLNWLISHEETELSDRYGRVWKYENFHFYFKDVDCPDFKEGLGDLHLYKMKFTDE